MLKKFDQEEAHIVLAGIASALATLTINAGYNEEQSVESYRRTFRAINAQIIEDEGGHLH